MSREYPLEDVYRLLEGLDLLLVKLRSPGPDRLRVDDLPELFETIHELGGWRNTTYLQSKLGINGSLLNQFMQLKGTILRSDALKITDRLRTHLRSHDQATSSTPEPLPSKLPTKQKTKKKTSAHATVIRADRWIAIRESSETKLKIAAISSLLDSIVQQVKHANAPPKDQLLTDMERRQLIAILETALNVLRSPLLEKGLLRKASASLKKAAASAAEKGVQQGLGKLMDGAGARILELLATIFR